MVQNGNFTNTDYWTRYSSISNGIATQTAQSQTSYIPIAHTAIDYIPSHRYYLKVEALSNNNDTKIYILPSGYTSDGNSSPTLCQTWTKLTYVWTAVSTANHNILEIAGGSTSGPCSFSIKNVIAVDLTKMFGTDAQIASALGLRVTSSTTQAQLDAYIKSQAAVDAFESMFHAAYYPYNTGELLSFEGESLKTTDTVSGEHSTDISAWKEAGIPNFNVWDEQWENGAYYDSTGLPIANNARIRTKNAIRVLPNTDYSFTYPISGAILNIFWYDINDNFIEFTYMSGSGIKHSPNNAAYLRFYTGITYGTTYNNDICVNESVSWANGRYVKHGETCTLFPNGLCSAGSVHDEVFATTAIKRVGNVDLGSLTWVYSDPSNHFFRTDEFLTDVKVTLPDTTINVFISARYQRVSTNNYNSGIDKSIGISSTTKRIAVRDSSFSNGDTLKSSLNNVMLNYELATPVIITIPQRQDYSYPVSTSTVESIQPDNAMLSLGWNQLFNYTSIPSKVSTYGVTITNNNNGSFTITVVEGGATSTVASVEINISQLNHKFLFKGEAVQVRRNGSNLNGNVSTGYMYTNTDDASLSIRIRIAEGTPSLTEIVYPQVFDLTQMFGSGNEPTLEQFESMFPADYYSYNAGQQLYVYPSQQYYSIPASPSSGETKPFSAPAITTNNYGVAVNLPSGYTELQYIESTGTQYIDTGIISNRAYKYKVNFEPTSRTGAGGANTYNILGTWISDAANAPSLVLGHADTQNFYWSNYNTEVNNSPAINDTFGLVPLEIETIEGSLSIKGTSISRPLRSISDNNPYPLYLCCVNNNGTPLQYTLGKYYCFQVQNTNNNSLIHNFIPCINDNNEVGMYDKITHTFFGNSGTGVFVAGPVV